MRSGLGRRRGFIAGAALGLLVSGGALVFVGKGGAPRTSRPAAVVTPAVEEPATLVPFRLSAPTAEGDKIFADRLMRFGIALDRARRDPRAAADLPRREDALLADDVGATLGPEAAASIRDLLTVAKESASAPPFDQPSVTKLDLAVARLDNSLLSARLPYFVDVSVLTDPRGDNGRPKRIISLDMLTEAVTRADASAEERIAAALALTAIRPDEGERIRVAARACADPKLRVALDRLARDGEGDAEVASAIEEALAEDRDARA